MIILVNNLHHHNNILDNSNLNKLYTKDRVTELRRITEYLSR